MVQRQKKPKVLIETYGCQMNVLDSELVQGQLETLGYEWVDDAQTADVVLLNTCSVRDLAEQKVWSRLGRLGILKQREKPNLVIGVIGCMAEREGEQISRRMPHVDIVCGPSQLDRLGQFVENVRLNGASGHVAISGYRKRQREAQGPAVDGVEHLDLSRTVATKSNSFQAYVRITRGCNKFCSFCIVPYVRGPEVHRPPHQIIEEVQRLVDAGAREITLIGQTVNHYEFSEGGTTTSFADLLWRVHEATPSLPRLRFLTSYPRDFSDEALDVMANAERICRFLHIPVQSGSNRVLQAMNRGHTIETYESLLERARARMPDIRMTTDMIVGFPTETDEDHQQSAELLRRSRFKSCFVFKYSPRSGTVAHRRLPDDVPDGVKKKRNLELLDIQSDVSLKHHQSMIGQRVEVLVESTSKLRRDEPASGVMVGWKTRAQTSAETARLIARTRGDEIVAFDGPGSLRGQITHVHIDDATPLTLLGRWAAQDGEMQQSEVIASLG